MVANPLITSNMLKTRVLDAQGRKWKLRFTQYQDGWTWSASTTVVHQESEHSASEKRIGMSSNADSVFASREEARADAGRVINECDHVAAADAERAARLLDRRGG